MNPWIEEKDKQQLEIMRETLHHLVKSSDTPPHTRQHAAIFLNEIEDRLWNSVCQNTPARLDQHQTWLQEK